MPAGDGYEVEYEVLYPSAECLFAGVALAMFSCMLICTHSLTHTEEPTRVVVCTVVSEEEPLKDVPEGKCQDEGVVNIPCTTGTAVRP